MRIKLRQPKEITDALAIVISAYCSQNDDWHNNIIDDDGRTINLFNFMQVARELDLNSGEKKALKVLESAVYGGRNFARLDKKIKFD